MHLRCPHCQNPIELADLPSGGEITCAGCGSSFQLATAVSTATWDKAVGKRLGKFEVLGMLGHGAFGTVVKAHDSELDRIVAIKIPRAGNVGPDLQDLDRFLREARSVAQLHFPSIITIHEIGIDDGAPYLVCDFVEGVTLADMLTGRGLTFQESAKLIAEVADALQYAHSLGVVHRDVKPSNIMIRPDGSPCVMDFGLAKRDAGEITMTIDGQILGTPAYMSPEQARGESHQVDGRSDVYSLGVILYQLLTGELPFRGNKSMLLHQVLHEEPRSPRTLNDKIPRDLETIALKAMAKEPGRRYGSAKVLADDLRRWLVGEPILARPVGTVDRAWRWCKRKPAEAGLIAAIALLVLGVFSATLWYQADHARQATGQALRDADTSRKLAVTEEGVRQTLTQATRIRAELHGVLQKQGGLQELLNQPARWHFLIQSAQSELAQARRLMARAEGILDAEFTQTMDNLEQQLSGDEADRLLALRLERIRVKKVLLGGGISKNKATGRDYAIAFTDANLRIIEGDLKSVAVRISASPIKEQLIVGLDDWGLVEYAFGQKELARRLFQITQLASPDPPWGNRVRQRDTWRELEFSAELLKTAFVGPDKMSPQMALMVGSFLTGQNDADCVLWLRKAQALYPGDFFLNFALGNVLYITRSKEAESFYRAAIAARPGSYAAFYSLGNALNQQNRTAEATDVYQRAIDLDEDPSYRELGEVLQGYFPVPLGAHWSYVYSEESTGTAAPLPIINKVAKIERREDGLHAQIETSNDLEKWEKLDESIINAKGVFSINVADKKLGSPIPVLKLPLKEGDTWAMEIPSADQKVKSTWNVGKKETVKVKAGTYEAIPITRTTTHGKKTTWQIDWYAPHVGLVKFSTRSGPDDAIVMELAAFEIVK